MNRDMYEYVYMHICVDMLTGLRLAPDGNLLMHVYVCIHIFINIYTYVHIYRHANGATART